MEHQCSITDLYIFAVWYVVSIWTGTQRYDDDDDTVAVSNCHSCRLN